MYKLMQKYRSKLLALFMVVLMITFFMPQFKGSSRTPGEVTIGRIGSQKINAAEVNNSRAEWNMLRQSIVYPNPRAQQGQPNEMPVAMTMGEAAVRQIEEHPPMFLMLLKEARSRGVSVSERDLSTELAQINIRLPDGRTVLFENLGDSEMADEVRQAMTDYLLVRGAYERAASVVKVSQPLLSNRLAKEAQEIKLNLITFDAKDYLPKVPTPSQDALQKQFDKYADVLPVEYDPTNSDPAGFGYKYPDRVKLQYIAIPRDQVKAAVKASKSDYDWEVEAQRYYRKNASEFPVTQPTSKPSDLFSLDPNSKSARTPTSGPTTRPFAEVRGQVLDAIIDPQVQKLMQAIETKITVTMANDYGLYRAAMRGGTTAPSTAPATALGVPFDSFDYLQKLAADVQKEFKVLPTIASLGESFLAEKQLEKLPGIGESFATMRQTLVPFPAYAIIFASPFHPEREEGIHLFEISRPLFGRETTYLFRLTAADPAHKPASLNDVLDAVTRDVKLVEAMKLAHDAADAAMQAARASGLRQAAVAANKPAVSSGFFSSQPRGAIPGVTVGTDSMKTFVDAAFGLLADAAKDSHAAPMRLIDLPRDEKVLVAQLADVSMQIDPVHQAVAQAQVAGQLTMELRQPLYNRWFTWDDLTHRLSYQDETHGSKKPAPEG